jgi:hypothetical protein
MYFGTTKFIRYISTKISNLSFRMFLRCIWTSIIRSILNICGTNALKRNSYAVLIYNVYVPGQNSNPRASHPMGVATTIRPKPVFSDRRQPWPLTASPWQNARRRKRPEVRKRPEIRYRKAGKNRSPLQRSSGSGKATYRTSQRVRSPGWPDWANFSLLVHCLLWAWKKPKFLRP